MPPSLSEPDRQTLLRVARDAVTLAARTHRLLEIRARDFSAPLQEHRATFVTLHRLGQLRGCIGILHAVQPLVQDVAEHAFAAAMQDPRFPPLSEAELAGLDIHLSILSPPAPMTFADEADLIRQLQPGIDGLIFQDGPRRSTFLPAVWASLPDPRQFLEHLKLKAGLPPAYWSPTVRIQRYTTESIP